MYALYLQVGVQVFAAHRYILASASPAFSSLLQPGDDTHTPECVKSLSESNLVIDCDPEIFESFLHYLYGSSIRVVPPSSSQPPSGNVSMEQESTPDTSVASVDENDLTAIYDRYGSVTDDNGSQWFVDDCFLTDGGSVDLVRQSTPKKKGSSASVQEGV